MNPKIPEHELVDILKEIKVVILAAGGATRMKPLSNVIAKPMLPFGNTPLIGKIIQEFFSLGVHKFIVVYGSSEDQIVPYLEFLSDKLNITIDKIRQLRPMGMADAILLTKSIIFNESPAYSFPWFVSAGDVLFPAERLKKTLRNHMENNAEITLPSIYSEDPLMATSYGNMKCLNNRVLEIVEKPGAEKRVGNYYSMPIYLFQPNFFKYLDKVEISKRGEKELQDAIQMVIDENKFVAGINLLENLNIMCPFDGEYHITFPEDFLMLNFRYQREYGTKRSKEEQKGSSWKKRDRIVDEQTFVSENVLIDENTHISKSYIFPNAHIGSNCTIEMCIIAENVKIPNSTELKEKIVLISGIHDLISRD